MTPRDRLNEMFMHCADLGIEVEWATLQDRRRGAYYWRRDTIVLSLRLTQAQAVSTLAHEIAHHVLGDQCSTPPAERRAWELAAAMLVTPDEYRRAESLAGHHASALAIELGVTVKVIHAWRRWWETKGQHLNDTDEARFAGDD